MSRARERKSKKSAYCRGEMLARRACVVATNALIVASSRGFSGGASTGKRGGCACFEAG